MRSLLRGAHPEHLAGYGPMTPEDAEKLTALLDEIEQSINEL
jgi:hypothetical protein